MATLAIPAYGCPFRRDLSLPPTHPLVDLGRQAIPSGNTGMNTLTLDQAAELLKLHPQTVLQRARLGETPAAKPGKCWVFIEDDLINWLRSLYNTCGDARQGGQALCSLKEKTPSPVPTKIFPDKSSVILVMY